VESALEQFSEDVFFQDMMFPEPIRGKAELREHTYTHPLLRCLSGLRVELCGCAGADKPSQPFSPCADACQGFPKGWCS